MKLARIEPLIRKALGLLPNRAILVCVVVGRKPEKKEVILRVEDSERILLLKQVAHKLWVDDGGDLKEQSNPLSPREIGDVLVVVPTTHNPDCKKVVYWGYLDDLLRLADPKPAFGSLASVMEGVDLSLYDLSPPDSLEVAEATEALVTSKGIVVEDDGPVIDNRPAKDRLWRTEAVRCPGKPKLLKPSHRPSPVKRPNGLLREAV
jgi:hypothetical protein